MKAQIGAHVETVVTPQSNPARESPPAALALTKHGLQVVAVEARATILAKEAHLSEAPTGCEDDALAQIPSHYAQQLEALSGRRLGSAMCG